MHSLIFNYGAKKRDMKVQVGIKPIKRDEKAWGE